MCVSDHTFDECARKLSEVYESSKYLTSFISLTPIFDVGKLVELMNITKLPVELETYLTYILSRVDEIDSKIRNTRHSILIRSKKEVNPKSVDIISTKFQTKFEGKKSDWNELYGHLEAIVNKSADVSKSLEPIYDEQINSLNIPNDSNNTVDHIKNQFENLYAKIQNYSKDQREDSKKNLEKIPEVKSLIKGLREMARVQLASTSHKGVTFSSQINNILVNHRRYLSEMHTRIFAMPVETPENAETQL